MIQTARRKPWIPLAALVAVGALVLAVLGFSLFMVLRDDPATDGAPAAGGPTGRPAPPPVDGSPPRPVGQAAGWNLTFGDEFEGGSLDRSIWTDRSSAESDEGHGNKDNQQLEWNQADNCDVSDGELRMTARRESFVSPSGERYDWTSCLISSTPSYAFQFGYIEERAIMPPARGFWPAFWTWQAPGVNRYVETDVYEYHSENRRELYFTQNSQAKESCSWTPPFDPTADWHTYGAAIEPSGTTWYVDGVKVCETRSTSDGETNIISNLAVFSEKPPADDTDTAIKRVDYIRAWQRA